MSYKDYSSLYINLGIFKAKIQMLFISYRNLVLETKFNFTYEFGYQTSTGKNSVLFMLSKNRVFQKQFQV